MWKFSTFFGITLGGILIGLINGEVNFCFEFDSTNISENEGSLEEVSTLLEEVSPEKITQEVKKIINESIFGTETRDYTHIHFNFSHPAITLEGEFNNGTTYTAEQLIRLWTIKDGGLEIFNLTFPYIFMNGSYRAIGYVGANNLFGIYGNGTFHLNMKNFSIAVATGLKINSSSLCVPLSVNVYLKDFESNFVDFMNGDDELEPLLNYDIQAMVPEALKIIFREDMDLVDPYIQAIIDKLFHGTMKKSLSKLLYVLSKNKDQLESILKNV